MQDSQERALLQVPLVTSGVWNPRNARLPPHKGCDCGRGGNGSCAVSEMRRAAAPDERSEDG